MSDLKPMPLAAVLLMLQHAQEVTGRRLATTVSNQLTQAMEEKRFLNAELIEEPLDAA